MKGILIVLGVVSVVSFVAGPALAYFDILPAQSSFLIFVVGCGLGILVAIAGTITAIRVGPHAALAGTILGLIPTVFVVYTVVTTYRYPLINDVSTDRVMPPAFQLVSALPENAKRDDMSFPAANKTIIEEAYPDLQSLGLPEDAYGVFNRAMDLARLQKGWTVIGTTVVGAEGTPNPSYGFEGYSVSELFGFTDDFAVRVTEVEGGCVVDMRSKSRLGKGDFGANARRIRDFLAELQK